MLRNLLVHVSGDETGRGRVALALGLAQRTGARLTGMHVMQPADISAIYTSRARSMLPSTTLRADFG